MKVKQSLPQRFGIDGLRYYLKVTKKPPVFRRLIIYLQSFTSLSINLWLDVFAGTATSLDGI